MYACISLASAQDAVAYVPGHLSPGPCSHEAIPRFLPARDPLGTIPGTRGSRLTSSSSPLFPATPDSSPDSHVGPEACILKLRIVSYNTLSLGACLPDKVSETKASPTGQDELPFLPNSCTGLAHQ